MSYRQPTEAWYRSADARERDNEEISAGPEITRLAPLLASEQRSISLAWLAAGAIAGGAIGLLLGSIAESDKDVQRHRHEDDLRSRRYRVTAR